MNPEPQRRQQHILHAIRTVYPVIERAARYERPGTDGISYGKTAFAGLGVAGHGYAYAFAAMCVSDGNVPATAFRTAVDERGFRGLSRHGSDVDRARLFVVSGDRIEGDTPYHVAKAGKPLVESARCRGLWYVCAPMGTVAPLSQLLEQHQEHLSASQDINLREMAHLQPDIRLAGLAHGVRERHPGPLDILLNGDVKRRAMMKQFGDVLEGDGASVRYVWPEEEGIRAGATLLVSNDVPPLYQEGLRAICKEVVVIDVPE